MSLYQEAEQAMSTYNRTFSLDAKKIIATKSEKEQVQYAVNPFFTWLIEHWAQPSIGFSGGLNGNTNIDSNTTQQTHILNG